jgi:hypothetical protein
VNESVDRRILGAFQCVDGLTGNSLSDPFPVSSEGWVLKRNASGTYVIFDGPNFDALTSQFIPAASWPTPGAFEVTIQDPGNRYQARRAILQAPQKVTPITDPAAVFTPQTVKLYPTASAPVGPNWAVIRASVVQAGTNPAKGLPFAALQVKRNSDQQVLAEGMADGRGEAILAVAGLKMQPGTAVTPSTVAVTVGAWFDPTTPSPLPTGWIPNPDDVLQHLASTTLKSTSQTTQLGAGMDLPMTFVISI